MKWIMTLCFFVFTYSTFASGLLPDRLIYKNDTIDIYHGLLESYVKKNELRNDIINFFGGFNTACKRGYIAIWEIRNDSLFLNNLRSCNSEETADLNEFFKEKCINNKVFADWDNDSHTYNSYGEIITRQNWTLVTAFYQVFHFEKGILKSVKHYDDRSNPSYGGTVVNKFIYENIDWNLIKDYTKEKTWINFQITSDGKPTIIRIDGKYSINEIVDKEIIRVISMLPKNSYPYEKDENWTMQIYLDKKLYEEN